MKKSVIAIMVFAAIVLTGCNNNSKSTLESVVGEKIDVVQNDSTVSSSDQIITPATNESTETQESQNTPATNESTETQESQNTPATTPTTNGSTTPREYTKVITMKYGNDSEIIFDWDKSDEGSQTLYHSLKDEIDSSAIAIFSRETEGSHIITCSPAEDNLEKLKYECDDHSTITLYKNKINYILLQGEQTSQIGAVEILGTENKAKG